MTEKVQIDLELVTRQFDAAFGKVERKVKTVSTSIQKSQKKTRESLTKTAKEARGLGTAFSSMATGFTAGVFLIRAFDEITQSINETLQASLQFESGLVEVGKTSGLVGKELTSLGKEIENLTKVLPVTSAELLENAKVAGQLGVEGSKNILKYAETIAKLGRVSNLEGENAASTLARILNVTREGQDTIDEFASVIVSLGNNFAATESEIARVANEVARATAEFGITAGQAAALGATLRSLGIRSEEAGTVMGKSFRAIKLAIENGGDSLRQLEIITGESGAALRKQFGNDAVGVFNKFISGLGRMGAEGKFVTAELTKFGLIGERIAKVLPTLSTNSDELTRALRLQNAEVGTSNALNEEFNRILVKGQSEIDLLSNAMERFSRVTGDKLNKAIKFSAPLLAELFSQFAETGSETIARRSKDINELTAELANLTEKAKTVNELSLLDPFRIFLDDADEVEDGINAISKALLNLSTEKATKELKALQAEVEFLQGAATPDFLRLTELDAQIKAKKQMIAVANSDIRALNAMAEQEEKAAAIASRQETFDALNALEQAQVEIDAEAQQAELLALEVQTSEEFSVLETALGRQKAAKILFRANELAEDGKLAQAQILIAKSLSSAKEKISKEEVQRSKDNAKEEIRIDAALLSAGARFAGAAAAIAKKGSAERKGFAITEAIINTYAGATRALRDYPAPASYVVAGSIVAAGLANVHKITSTGNFAEGGVVGGSSFAGDNLQANVNANEVILNPRQAANTLFKIANSGNTGSGNNEAVVGAINSLGDRISNMEIVLQANDTELARSVSRGVSNGVVIGVSE